MCGITGFVGPGTDRDLAAMNDALTHRGPDASGSWVDEEAGIFLAMSRLSVLDPAHGGQPMWTGDGELCVVFNGEIYNHAELRRDLESRGHRFRSLHSDTEILLHGYRQWGFDLPNRLNGMWAWAILDRRDELIFLCRDRFGQKPLFYTHHNGLFAFSSELTSLLKHPGIEATLSVRAVQKYFAYGYVPAPLSICERVFKLPAGHLAVFSMSEGKLGIERYWRFELEADRAFADQDAACEELRELIDRAVRRRMVADVPLGVFLSGGIDSSTVSYFAAAADRQRSVSSFSIGFSQASFDESTWAKRAAQAIGTQHRDRVLSIDAALELLPQLMDSLDEPMGDASLLPTYQLCELARESVTVALGGDGADEFFCGYDPFVALKWAELHARYVPKPLHRAIRLLASRLPVSHQNISLDFKVKRTLTGLSFPRKIWLPTWLGPLDIDTLSLLFDEDLDIEDVFEEAVTCWESCDQAKLVDRTIQFFVTMYLQDDILTKIDRAGMLHSLEVRAPFLDIDLVDFVRHIPSTHKFHRGQRKVLLKRAMRGYLPDFVINRSKKGFGVPVGRWFRTGELQPTSGRKLGFLNTPLIDRMVGEHRCGKHDHRSFLWSLWVLEAWVERHIHC